MRILFLLLPFLPSCGQHTTSKSENTFNNTPALSAQPTAITQEIAVVYKKDTSEITKRAEIYFEEYIKVRLQEFDESGAAVEYKDAREFYSGDINLDQIPDAIVLYTIEGVDHGNNWYRNILFLVNDGKKFTAMNHCVVYGTLRAQGNFSGISDGFAVFNIAEYTSPDLIKRMTENPQAYKKVGFGIRGDSILEVDL